MSTTSFCPMSCRGGEILPSLSWLTSLASPCVGIDDEGLDPTAYEQYVRGKVSQKATLFRRMVSFHTSVRGSRADASSCDSSTDATSDDERLSNESRGQSSLKQSESASDATTRATQSTNSNRRRARRQRSSSSIASSDQSTGASSTRPKQRVGSASQNQSSRRAQTQSEEIRFKSTVLAILHQASSPRGNSKALPASAILKRISQTKVAERYKASTLKTKLRTLLRTDDDFVRLQESSKGLSFWTAKGSVAHMKQDEEEMSAVDLMLKNLNPSGSSAKKSKTAPPRPGTARPSSSSLPALSTCGGRKRHKLLDAGEEASCETIEPKRAKRAMKYRRKTAPAQSKKRGKPGKTRGHRGSHLNSSDASLDDSLDTSSRSDDTQSSCSEHDLTSSGALALRSSTDALALSPCPNTYQGPIMASSPFSSSSLCAPDIDFWDLDQICFGELSSELTSLSPSRRRPRSRACRQALFDGIDSMELENTLLLRQSSDLALVGGANFAAGTTTLDMGLDRRRSTDNVLEAALSPSAPTTPFSATMARVSADIGVELDRTLANASPLSHSMTGTQPPRYHNSSVSNARAGHGSRLPDPLRPLHTQQLRYHPDETSFDKLCSPRSVSCMRRHGVPGVNAVDHLDVDILAL